MTATYNANAGTVNMEIDVEEGLVENVHVYVGDSGINEQYVRTPGQYNYQ